MVVVAAAYVDQFDGGSGTAAAIVVVVRLLLRLGIVQPLVGFFDACLCCKVNVRHYVPGNVCGEFGQCTLLFVPPAWQAKEG